ncbi:unnamed protein product [Nesidiocoris tenuis]|uniref:Uncharacterized protein n=1 Tax=Nesidiocoris tenuis TaxID=355587 RepID=A0A6H5GEQ1_9HEMI|nr:unnamed protein product [Nesidiocoris tenuis]
MSPRAMHGLIKSSTWTGCEEQFNRFKNIVEPKLLVKIVTGDYILKNVGTRKSIPLRNYHSMRIKQIIHHSSARAPQIYAGSRTVLDADPYLSQHNRTYVPVVSYYRQDADKAAPFIL